MKNGELELKARQIRRQVLEMIAAAGKGHIGGSFSCIEILVSLYYGGILRFNAKNPRWADRDRFILSKGHACAALYAILADLGFFSKDELKSFNREGSRLEGHPHTGIPGIDASTGSLGHGLGIGAGMALASKMDEKDFRTFVLMGDGECHEGSVWEAAMFAGHHKLNKLVAIIDENRLCSTDFLADCLDLSWLGDKWRAFGWDVVNVQGHDPEQLIEAMKKNKGKPLAVIAHTIKGKGVSFMEDKVEWHHRIPDAGELELARRELE
ncbi:MAG: transketolase [Dehalococcoidales bacterium]|nr:transketolase [Dehalococcoidales bacterium]